MKFLPNAKFNKSFKLMGKKLFTIALCLFISIGAAWAQTIRVSGTVTDVTNGEPVVGAAVQLKGSASTYALTDVSGKYTLSVPADAILTVSSLGFNPTEVQVNGRGVVDIELTPEAQLLDDVLVVAYGTAKKESFTGSAGTVKSESLQKRTVATCPRRSKVWWQVSPRHQAPDSQVKALQSRSEEQVPSMLNQTLFM